LRNADILILVYDITNKNSFELCKNFYRDKIKENCHKNIKVILLGNKNDLDDKREVSTQEGYDFALKNEYIFIETSCLKNENIYEIIENAIIEGNLLKKIMKEKRML